MSNTVILKYNILIKSEQLTIKFHEDLMVFPAMLYNRHETLVCVHLKDECSLDKVKALLPGHDGHKRLTVLRGTTPIEKEIQQNI